MRPGGMANSRLTQVATCPAQLRTDMRLPGTSETRTIVGRRCAAFAPGGSVERS